MTLDTTAARLEGLLERANVVLRMKTGCGSQSVHQRPDSRLVGFITAAKSQLRVEHVLALVDIAVNVPALLSERRALRAEVARLRGHNAKISDGLFDAQIAINDLNKEIERLQAALTANGGEHD